MGLVVVLVFVVVVIGSNLYLFLKNSGTPLLEDVADFGRSDSFDGLKASRMFGDSSNTFMKSDWGPSVNINGMPMNNGIDTFGNSFGCTSMDPGSMSGGSFGSTW